jgi:hypothetical protein
LVFSACGLPDHPSKWSFFVHQFPVPGNPVDIEDWGNNMRKVALLAAVALSAAFANTTPSVAQDNFYEMNKNTFLFLQGPGGPSAAVAQPAAAPKVAKAKKKKKM